MNDQATLLRQVRLALQNDDHANAIQALGALITLAEAAQDHAALARHRGNLALIYHRQNRSEIALEHLNAAIADARAEQDPALESGLLGNVGNILREMGRHEEATQHLQLALALAVDSGDQRGRGIWLGNLALVYDDMGESVKAIPFHEQSIVVARELRDLRGLATRLGHLANSQMAFGDHPSALIHLQEAVMIYRDLGDKTNLARQLAVIGNLYVILGQRTATQPGMVYCYNRAIDQYRQSLNAAYDARDVVMQADVLRSLGIVFYYMQDYDQAINHLDTAYQMFSGLGIEAPLAELQAAVQQAHQARHVQSTVAV